MTGEQVAAVVERIDGYCLLYHLLPVPFRLRPGHPFSNLLKSTKMKLLLVVLTGYSLLSQPGPPVVQRGAAVPARGDLAVTVQGSAAATAQGGRTAGAQERAAGTLNQAQLKACCQKISRDIQRLYYLNNRNGRMRLVVRGIYTREKSLFFSLKLINRSSLDYDVDSIRFFVAEKQKGIHALRRLDELKPVFVFDSATLVKGYGHTTSVIVLPRLTLGRHHRLQIEVLEKNGGRQLLVQAANFTLEAAKLI